MTELRDQLQTTLGDSYNLEQELGGGGMSRVFVARETSLGRQVVVKVLPPDMAASVSIDRFRREIQMAAQLQHPHIVPLLSAGETGGLPFFTMPFVKGESLRAKLARGGELPLSEAIRTLREIATALAYAHENGVVHRDIKPENVLISGGSAMVTDFGVAKAVSAAKGPSSHNLTSMGVALGTPAYMSPEQASADPATDHRADIYALGIVAYEMLTGATPFSGRSPQAMLAAHVTEEPDPVTKRRPLLPPLLASLVMCCLEKRAADRPQSAADVVHQLDALTTPSGGMEPTRALPAASSGPKIPRKALLAAAALVGVALIGFAVARFLPSSESKSAAAAIAKVPVIAVLPFENRGNAEGQEFTDGMTEEITNRLSSLRGLRVIGRQSALSYAGSKKTPQQIAQELGVEYLLTGTVRWDRGGDGKELVRVSPALVRGSDATQVWSNAYQTILSGIFEVQAKVATEVADALNVALLAPEKDALVAAPTKNVEAYGYYLRGQELVIGQTEPRKLLQAVVALEKSVELDPKFAAAHAMLSLAHTEVFWFFGDRTAERLRKAKQSADRALALDPSLFEGHFALGVYHYHGFLEYEKALKEMAIAEQIRPNDFRSLYYRGAIYRRQGKWRESIASMTRGAEMEPRLGLLLSDVANSLIAIRDYDAAAAALDRALVVSPGDPDAVTARAYLAIARDANPTEAILILRTGFDMESNKSAASENYVFGASIAVGWPAVLDPGMRQAAIAARWSPELGERSSFVTNKMLLFAGLGDLSRARLYADSAVKLLTTASREQPTEAAFFGNLAIAHAVLGHRTEAISAIEKAVEIRPLARDAYGGGDILLNRVLVLVFLGDADAAISQLEQLLSIPAIISRNQIRLDPIFTPLRTNPRFQKLIAG